MKRTLLLVLAALAAGAGTAQATGVGVGVFAGGSIPIVQDDTGSGSQFGVRVPVHVAPLITIEPFFASSALGEVTDTFGGNSYSRKGFDVRTYGVNAALGGIGMMPGLSFYPYVGLASYKLSRDNSADISKMGYNFGLGLGFGLPSSISIGVRGELAMVVTDKTSRKFANVTAGITYKLLP